MIWKIAKATLLKIFRLRLVHHWTLIAEIFGATSMLIVFFLIDKFQVNLIGDRLKEALNGLETSYFGYVALGIAFSEFATSTLGGIVGQFQTEKRYGTIEVHLAHGISLFKWSVGAGITNLIHASGQFLIIILAATLILKLHIPKFHIDIAICLIAYSIIAFWSFSLISLSAMLVFRRGNIFAMATALAYEILGGVYVPIEVFPTYIQKISYLLPITPSLKALHEIFYKSAEWKDVSHYFLIITMQIIVYVPISIYAIKLADKISKRKGLYALE
ncbi:MAG: ABC transporter permease [Oligoflexia bacterium]|nr:ABC transporter permease [Oligoflexia bacterium]